MVRTDNSGNILWSNQYDQPGSDEAWGLTEDGNSLVVAGFYRAPDLYDGYVMKLDKVNGLAQWKRTYDANSNRHMLMAKIRLTNSGYRCFRWKWMILSGPISNNVFGISGQTVRYKIFEG